MEKEALFYKKIKEGVVQCELCPHKCIINIGKRGVCRVRENRNGFLYSLVYGKLCAANPESIFKKPIYHFLPGTYTYSIATIGCNLRCSNCQNWQISQARPEDVPAMSLTPKDIVKNAIQTNCKSIAYTFTEPTVFIEYVIETAKLARRSRLKNIMVTNGFINPEPLKLLLKYIDAFNVDLKSINEKFYEDICGAKLKPVLEAIKIIHKSGKHLEITNLLIPGNNDSDEEITKLTKWVKKNSDEEVPLHFSAFYPCYNMKDVPPTPREKIIHAAKIAKKLGMKNVYTGNI